MIIGEILVSGVIAAMLGLQALAVLNPVLGIVKERDGFLWPFLDYPMYARPHYKGEPVNRFVLVGVRADGSERVIAPAELRMNALKYNDGPVASVRSGDRASVEAFLHHYPAEDRAALVSLRLENRVVRPEAREPDPSLWTVVNTVSLVSDAVGE